jgi:hypothetical protein
VAALRRHTTTPRSRTATPRNRTATPHNRTAKPPTQRHHTTAQRRRIAALQSRTTTPHSNAVQPHSDVAQPHSEAAHTATQHSEAAQCSRTATPHSNAAQQHHRESYSYMLTWLSLGIIYVSVLPVYCRRAAFKYYYGMRCDLRKPYNNRRVKRHTVRYVIMLCQLYKASICLHCYHWVSYTCLYCQNIVVQQLSRRR